MKDALNLLATLVACPSESGSEAKIAALVTGIAGELGLGVTRFGDSLVVRAGSRTKPDPVRILLCSHLDTVPIGAGWTSPPLDAGWQDGRLVGRGSNDAKASGAAMLWALFQCAREGLADGVAVALTACEETTNTGMEEVLAGIGLPAMAVVGEPTGLQVVRAQGGLAVIEAHWSGVSCHAAHAATRAHENALIRAAGELAAFGPFASLPTEHPLLGPTTIVPSIFTSGKRHNVVPDSATAVFDCRTTPPMNAASCVEHLRSSLPTALIKVRSERLHAVETSAEHRLVQAALEITGNQSAIGSNTLSDMAFLGGVPSIKCGPGDTKRSHTPDEYVTEDEYVRGCGFYRSLLVALSAAPVGAVTR